MYMQASALPRPRSTKVTDPVPQASKMTLLTILAEVRVQVYKHLFQGCLVELDLTTLRPPQPLRQRYPEISGVSALAVKSSNARHVLLTCRQVLAEAIPIYYQQARLTFGVSMLHELLLFDILHQYRRNSQTAGNEIEQMAYVRARPFLKKIERAIISVYDLRDQLSGMLLSLREVWLDDLWFDTIECSPDEAKAMSFDEYWSIFDAQFPGGSGRVQALVRDHPKLAVSGRIIRYMSTGQRFSQVVYQVDFRKRVTKVLELWLGGNEYQV